MEKKFIEDMKNMRDKFFFVGVAVIIGLLLVSICSHFTCDSCKDEESTEVQNYEEEIIAQYEEEKAALELEVKEIEEEMHKLQNEISKKRDDLIQLEQQARQKIYENEKKNLNHKEEKKSDGKQKDNEKTERTQYNSHSFSLINGKLQGTFSSSDSDKIEEYKKAIAKYATITKEDDESFSFTTTKEKNWEKILEIGSTF